MGQLLLALNYMHQNEYYHKDLKPANILVYDKNIPSVCLADLGLCQAINNSEKENDGFGTPGYIPPELFKNRVFTVASDIFSLGVILFNMISRENLFQGQNRK